MIQTESSLSKNIVRNIRLQFSSLNWKKSDLSHFLESWWKQIYDHSIENHRRERTLISRLYNLYTKATRCLCVSMCACNLLRNGQTNLAKLFFVSSILVRGWFLAKKFRIQDPVFPKIRKNQDFRVLFDQFGWNSQVILTLIQICFNTNKFMNRVSGYQDPESGIFRKNPAKFIKNQV